MSLSINGPLTLNLGSLTLEGGGVFSTAGTPNAAVLTIQGDPAGEPVPVSGEFAIEEGTLTLANPPTDALPWPVMLGTNNAMTITSGTINIGNPPTGAAPWNVTLGTNNAMTVTGSVTANQGTPGAASAPWPVTLGTNNTFTLANTTLTLGGTLPYTSSPGTVTLSGNLPYTVSPSTVTLTGSSVTLSNPPTAAAPWSVLLGTNNAVTIASGTSTVNQGTNPWLVETQTGSVMTVEGGTITLAKTKTFAAINVNATAAHTYTLISANATKKIKLLNILMNSSSTHWLQIMAGTANMTGTITLTATGGFVRDTETGFNQTPAVNQAVILKTGGAMIVGGDVAWEEV